MSKSQKLKIIKVSMKDGDDTKVKVEFHGGAFSPEEFTSLFMAVLETYTEGLLARNDRVSVFEHFNNVFGIFLNKILPEDDVYKNSKAHKEFKEKVDATLGQENTESVKKATEDNRLAAYLLTRDILIKEIGLNEESADLLINKRLGIIKELNSLDVEKIK